VQRSIRAEFSSDATIPSNRNAANAIFPNQTSELGNGSSIAEDLEDRLVMCPHYLWFLRQRNSGQRRATLAFCPAARLVRSQCAMEQLAQSVFRLSANAVASSPSPRCFLQLVERFMFSRPEPP